MDGSPLRVGALRDQLVTTLEATVRAEAGRISQLQRDLDTERTRSAELEARLARVEGLLEECLNRRRAPRRSAVRRTTAPTG